MYTKTYFNLFILLALAGVISCDKDRDAPDPPKGVINRIEIRTDSLNGILYHDAKAYGSVGPFKSIVFSQYGHCWDTLEVPTVESSKTVFENLASQSTFASELTNLKPNRKYFVCGYAQSNLFTLYGEILNFTTKELESPTLKTDSTSALTSTSAVLWGTIMLDGGTPITAKGVCWGATENPSLADQHTESQSQTSIFSVNLSGLTRNTTYHARVYATNQSGLSYGNDFTFSTNAELTTTVISNITSTTATSGGSITSGGNATITARGVCWSTTQNTSLNNSHTSDGTGSGIFTSSLTGLQSGTTYYVRAYAANSSGTGYGNEVSFKTTSALPTITTTTITSITGTTATSGGNVSSDGGETVTARGVCWNTSSNPTTANSKTVNGEGTGVFTSSMVGLVANTLYYVRAYATNSLGTAYGNEVNFSTSSLTVTDIDGNVYNTVKIGTQTWMKENLKTTKYRDGSDIPYVTDDLTWAGLTTGAYTWYNNNISNKNIYGAMYNFYTVADSRNLCPAGWHVPTDAEWTTLANYLGGSNFAGGKLKATTLWNNPNTGATNESGFTALPGGFHGYEGYFGEVGVKGFWWSSDAYDAARSWERSMHYDDSVIFTAIGDKRFGFSVRCLRDL